MHCLPETKRTCPSAATLSIVHNWKLLSFRHRCSLGHLSACWITDTLIWNFDLPLTSHSLPDGDSYYLIIF